MVSGNLFGPQVFDFDSFDNDFVKVSPTGDCIEIGFRDFRRYYVYSRKLRHPFVDMPDIPPQKGWDKIRVQIVSPDEMNIIFYKGDTSNVLTIVCTDANVSPKPITITWE